MFCFDMYAKENNFEILCLYIWLDNMMNRCKFTERQKQILDYYQEGCSEEEIAEYLECTPENIYKNLNTIIKKIQYQVKLNFKYDNIEWTKTKTKTKWKQCSKCKQFKPMTEKFYRERKDSKDGFRQECRICEISAKNS